MICDKCLEEVEPQDNALLYDAALESISKGRYRSKTDIWVDIVPTFREGVIIPGNPIQSIKRALHNYARGRHLSASATCEGSPSRRRNIGEGIWGDGTPMGELAECAQQAYEIVKALETPIPVH